MISTGDLVKHKISKYTGIVIDIYLGDFEYWIVMVLAQDGLFYQAYRKTNLWEVMNED
jgi:hypothetical protein|tara:strand:+ start:250 stop:423 length:174 start_codon:yes stop_codon:yes gene_type:complete